MIGIGLGVVISQGASCARQSLPASSSKTRLSGFSDSRAAMTAPAEPPPTTITSYIDITSGIISFAASIGFVHIPEHRRCRTVQDTGHFLAPEADRKILTERNVGR